MEKKAVRLRLASLTHEIAHQQPMPVGYFVCNHLLILHTTNLCQYSA